MDYGGDGWHDTLGGNVNVSQRENLKNQDYQLHILGDLHRYLYDSNDSGMNALFECFIFGETLAFDR